MRASRKLLWVPGVVVVLLAGEAEAGRYWIGRGAQKVYSNTDNWSSSNGGNGGASLPGTGTGKTYFRYFQNGEAIFDMVATGFADDIFVNTNTTDPFYWRVTDPSYGLQDAGRYLEICSRENGEAVSTLWIAGGTHACKYLRIGNRASSHGYLTLADATMTVTDLQMSHNGMAGSQSDLTILAGGVLTVDSWAYLASSPESEARLTVRDGGRWKVKKFMLGGSEEKKDNGVSGSYAAVILEEGGRIEVSDNSCVGASGGDSLGELVIRGGEFVCNAKTLYVGAYGNGKLTMSGGKLTMIDSEYGLNVAYGRTGSSTLQLSGGELTIPRFRLDYTAPGCVINFDGTTVKATRDAANFLVADPNVTCTIQAGGLVIDTDGHDVTIGHDLAGVGGIVKKGAGTLTLAGAVRFAGDIVVEEGEVVTGEPMTSKETIDGTRGGVRTEPVRLHRMPFHDWTTDADFTTFKTVHHGAGLADYDAPRFIDVDFGGPAPLSFTNLLIGTTYEWTGTKADGTVVSGAFTTENVPPRTLYVPVGNTGATVKNVRDLGGWPLMGRTAAGLTAIRQGVLYRGANADAFIGLSASEKAANPLHTQLGVVTEIDLRGDNDPLATEGASPICPAIRYSYCPMTDNTLGGGDTFTNALRQVFRTLSSEDALPAYFHCKIGCDRTGIVAALILGICGVDEEVIFRDYLASAFARVDSPRDLPRMEAFFRQILSGHAGPYVWADRTVPYSYGKSVAGHCRAYLEMCGVTPAELSAVTFALTGETIDEVLARVDAYEREQAYRTVTYLPFPGSLQAAAMHRLPRGKLLFRPAEIGTPTRTGYAFVEWGEASETAADANGDSYIYGSWDWAPGDNAGVVERWTGGGGNANLDNLGNWELGKLPAGRYFIDEAINADPVINVSGPDNVIAQDCCVYAGSYAQPFRMTGSDATSALRSGKGEGGTSGMHFYTTAVVESGTWDYSLKVRLRNGSVTVGGANLRSATALETMGVCDVFVTSGALETGTDGFGAIRLGVEGDSYTRFTQTGGRVVARATAENDPAALRMNCESKSKSKVSLCGGTFEANGDVFVASASSSYGWLDVDGGALTVAENLNLSRKGRAFMTVASGTVSVGGRTVCATETAGEARLTLRGGVFETAGIDSGAAEKTSVVTFDGGLLRARSGGTFVPATDCLELSVAAGGARIDTAGYDISVAPPFVGPGALVKSGEGTLRLESAPQCAGGTRVEGGRLIVPAGTRLDGLELAEGARLAISVDPYVWNAGHSDRVLAYTLKPGSRPLTADNVEVLGVVGGLGWSLDFGADALSLTVTGAELVWNAADGTDWTAANAWRLGDAAATFAAGTAVRFDAGSFGADAVREVAVTDAVVPGGLMLAQGGNRTVRLAGGGSVAPTEVLVSAGSGLALADVTLALPDGKWDNGMLTLERGGLVDETLAIANRGAITVAVPADEVVTLDRLTGRGAVTVASGTLHTNGGIAGPIAANGTLVFGGGTFTAPAGIAGAGEIRLTGDAEMTVNAYETLRDFTGTLTVAEGGTLNVLGPNHDDDETSYILGPYATLRLAGGTIGRMALSGQGSNWENLGTKVEIADGTSTLVNNHESRDGFGTNLRFRCPIVGSGTATLSFGQSTCYFMENCDMSGFSGTLNLTGTNDKDDPPRYKFTSVVNGSPSATYDISGRVRCQFDHASETTMTMGALKVGEEVARMQLGHTFGFNVGGNGGDCEFSAPITDKKFVVEKVGSGDLTFGRNLTTLAGSELTMSGGTFVGAAEATQNVALAFAPGTGYRYTGVPFATTGAVTGLAGTTLTVAEGLDITRTYTMLTAQSIDGRPQAIVSPAYADGTWKVRLTTGASGATCTLTYRKNGLFVHVQ